MKDISPAKEKKKIIGVIGGAQADEHMSGIAYELGKEIARNGYILVCGGLGGVMEAACRGAYEAGGTTLGILPGAGKDSANPYVSIPVVTAMSHARNAIIVRTADILVAVDGRYGTLSEIALAKAIGKRVIGLYTWEEVPGVEHAGSVEDAVGLIKES
ncbi:MAG: TIGR00725 family protein [Elusimicrobia bacterium]|nr:TIGR00725 family protein [Elusimicrobiota bacterium]